MATEKPTAGQAEVETWLGHIQSYDRAFAKWEKRAQKIVKRYRDERGERGAGSGRFNILWSNTQVLSSATFARLPKPDVSRRFKDTDPVGRVASLILERALEYEVEHYPDYQATLKADVLDRFLGGRATAWARYDPHFKKSAAPAEPAAQITEDAPPPPDEPEDKPAAPAEELEYECAPTDYVHWKDFGHTLARSWEEVTAVWRKVYMTREAMVARFGKDGESVPLDAKPEEMKEAEGSDRADLSRGCVYEIWNKTKGEALWLSKSIGKILDRRADPLELEEFFPCPKPMYATLANDKLEPTPDFAMYQYQADQLDTLVTRIEGLIDAMKVMGVYDASITELGRLFLEGENTNLFPIKNWAAYAEKGKLAGAIEYTDLKPIYEALREAYLAMGQIKGQIYEITRISDIMRGEVDPREKLGQSQLKSQYGNLGIKAYQMQIAQFATDLLRLKAQIMCNKFSPNTLLKISAVGQLSDHDKQLIPQAMALLLGPRLTDPKATTPNPLRGFRIEIAADSLIEIDDAQEKDARMSFIAANTGFMKEAMMALGGAGPAAGAMVPLVMEIWKFGVTGFKVGKAVEGSFDEATEKLKQLAANPPQKPPDPQAMKVEADAKLEANRQQFEQGQSQQEHQFEVAKSAAEAQQREHERQAKEAQDEREAQMKLAHQEQMEQMRLASQEREAQMNTEFQRWKAELDAATKLEIARIQAGLAADQSGGSDPSTEIRGDIAGLREEFAAIMQMISAPRTLKVSRDATGKLSGGEISTRLN